MSYSESYECDVCGNKKGEGGDWWLAWVDCFQGEKPDEDQPLIKLTRWQKQHAHSAGVKHLCGARCAGTFMDRWMSEQHEDPEAHCASAPTLSQVTPIERRPQAQAVGMTVLRTEKER